MARNKKDAKYLNVYLDKSVYDEFDQFCNEFGQTKTLATERALKAYMKDMREKMSANTDKND